MKNRKNILCDAKAFCFGPISKLLVVSELLCEKYNVIFLVSGTSKILTEHTKDVSIYECNTEDREDLLKHRHLFEEADIFINIMNPISAKFAAECNVPIVEIDSLFWMWESILDEILNSERYFIQNFDGVEEQLRKYGSQIKHPVLVGPIVKDIPDAVPKKNKLLINLGGMESTSIKVGVNTNYPFVITRILEETLSDQHPFDEIICAGNKDIIEKIKELLPKSTITFNFFDHDAFLRELAEAKILITSPGLTTAFESFNAEVPTFFLPPQNYSQYWNLDSFIKNDIAQSAINWNNLYPDTKIIKNEEQKKGIEKVLTCTNNFEHDYASQNKIKEYIRAIIKSDEKELKDVASKQKRYFDSLGGNGTNIIAKQIEELLSE